MTVYIGQKFGNYVLVRLLAQGGSADVYLGEHIYLKTFAAIKVLQARLASDTLESFLKEARTIAGLMHRNIIRVLEFGVEENVPFLVMDYATNGSLRQRFGRSVQQPLLDIIPYIKQIAAALQYAHERKVIHRDVKPENMLLGGDGAVLLSDFGIAVIAQSTRDQNRQGVAGTAPYMAPEQIRGMSSPKSDQYALAVVVYEWLSGNLPFEGTFVELVSQHLHAAPPPLCKKVPGLQQDVEEVVMIALRKEPERRFANIEVFAYALERASRSTRLLSSPSIPLVAQPGPHQLAPGVPPSHLRPLYEITTQSTGTAKMPQSAGASHVPPQQRPSHRTISRRSVVLGLIGLGAVAIGGTAWLASRTREGNLLSHAVTSPSRATLPPTTGIPTNSVSIIGNLLYTYSGHQDKVIAVAWSPDGGRIASGSWDQTVQVWGATGGGNAIIYKGHAQAINSVAWSPDGTSLVSSSLDGTAQVWDVVTQRTRIIYRGHAGSVFQYGVSAVAWAHAPKNLIASAGDDHTVQIWAGDTGRRIYTYKAHSDIVRCVAWSPDGQYIASGGFDKKVMVWHAATGTTIRTFAGHVDHICSVAWSPNGQYIISASDDGKVLVWKVSTAHTLATHDDTAIYQPRFDNLGRPLPQRNDDTFYAPGTNVFAVAWSRDGKRIASVNVGGYVLTWDALSSGVNISPYNGNAGFVNALAWSPDGRRIASGTDGSKVQVWQEA